MPSLAQLDNDLRVQPVDCGTDRMVVALVVIAEARDLHTGKTSVVISTSEGMSAITERGLVAAANDIFDWSNDG